VGGGPRSGGSASTRDCQGTASARADIEKRGSPFATTSPFTAAETSPDVPRVTTPSVSSRRLVAAVQRTRPDAPRATGPSGTGPTRGPSKVRSVARRSITTSMRSPPGVELPSARSASRPEPGVRGRLAATVGGRSPGKAIAPSTRNVIPSGLRCPPTSRCPPPASPIRAATAPPLLSSTKRSKGPSSSPVRPGQIRTPRSATAAGSTRPPRRAARRGRTTTRSARRSGSSVPFPSTVTGKSRARRRRSRPASPISTGPIRARSASEALSRMNVRPEGELPQASAAPQVTTRARPTVAAAAMSLNRSAFPRGGVAGWEGWEVTGRGSCRRPGGGST